MQGASYSEDGRGYIVPIANPDAVAVSPSHVLLFIKTGP